MGFDGYLATRFSMSNLQVTSSRSLEFSLRPLSIDRFASLPAVLGSSDSFLSLVFSVGATLFPRPAQYR
jgi:hypothetical protein